jgi:hypothetical protein
MKGKSWWVIGAFLALLGPLAPSPARAQSSASGAAAQALFDEARHLLEEGRPSEACPKLQESERLDPGSGTLLNLARCYELTGRLASAWNTYLEAASMSATAGNVGREATAREAAAQLQPKLSSLVIDVPPDAKIAGLVVKRDGESIGGPQWGVPIPTDEGEHTIAASAPNRQAWQAVILVKGEGQTVKVSVPKLAEAPPSGKMDTPPRETRHLSGGLGTQRTLALVSGGLGVVGIGIGTVFGLKSKSKHDEADGYCNGPACTDQRGVTAADAAISAGNVATVGFVVGAVGLAAGVTLWLTAPKRGLAPSPTELALGPGFVQLRRSW